MFTFWGDWCYKCAGWILQVESPVASILMVLHRWNQEALVLVSDARRQDLYLGRIKTAWSLPRAVWRGNVYVIACWHVASGKGRDIGRCHCFYLTENSLKRAAWKDRVNNVVCILRQRPSTVFLLSSASKIFITLFTCLYELESTHGSGCWIELSLLKKWGWGVVDWHWQHNKCFLLILWPILKGWEF